MRTRLTLAFAAGLAAVSLAVVPAGAQSRRGDGPERNGGRSVQRDTGSRQGAVRAVPRSAPNRQAAGAQVAPRANASRAPQVRAQAGRATQVAPRSNATRPNAGRQVAPRAQVRPNAGQQVAPRAQVQPRGNAGRAYAAPPQARRDVGPRAQGRAVPRQYAPAPRYRSGDRGYVYGSRSRFGWSYVRPYSFAPYRPYYFSRPYYSFRPRLNLGFGLWLGYSVAYPWTYYGSYQPRVYGYYAGGSYSPSYYGGVSFDIEPRDADLYVDGEYVGTVGTFTAYGEPLTLVPGIHQFAIVREGFRTMEWEVRIEPGQVLPYRGALVPW